MELKSIVVTAAGDPRYVDRLDLAFALAEAHDAYITVVHETPGPHDVISPGRAASAAYIAARLEAARDRAEALERQTLDHAKSKDRPVRWVLGPGTMHETIVREALLADLTIVGRSENSNFEDWFRDHMVDYLTRVVDTPVLYAPPAGDYAPIGRKVMIAWDGSNPAMRAVRVALPILRRADTVHVVSLGADDARPAPAGSALIGYLAQHGIAAELHGNEAAETEFGGALLEMADRLDADLIVMGAHSKPKLREVLFGSVTRTVLTTVTRPVLLSG